MLYVFTLGLFCIPLLSITYLVASSVHIFMLDIRNILVWQVGVP